MKILLVANYPIDRQSSMLRFARLLERGLKARGFEVRVTAPRAVIFPRIERASGIWKWVGYVNKFLVFPWTLRRLAVWADLVHICDHGNSPYVFALGGRPHVLTCHDVYAVRSARGLEPGNAVRATGRVLQAAILHGMRRSQRIVCDSTWTREQLLELAPELDERASVTELGIETGLRRVEEPERARLLLALGVADAPYFLHVGSDDRRKNRDGLVRIFSELIKLRGDLPHRLVLVGSGLEAGLLAAIRQCGLGSRVVALGKVTDEDLAALYSGAEALIFPSWVEGFGWPLVEAHACGCAVFASRRRPMTDLGGDGAVYFDPADPVAAAKLVLEHLGSLEALRAKGIANARRFETQRMIDSYVEVYREVLRVPGVRNVGDVKASTGHA